MKSLQIVKIEEIVVFNTQSGYVFNNMESHVCGQFYKYLLKVSLPVIEVCF